MSIHLSTYFSILLYRAARRRSGGGAEAQLRLHAGGAEVERRRSEGGAQAQRSSAGDAEYMRIHLSGFIYLSLSKNRVYLSLSILLSVLNSIHLSPYPSIHLSAYLSIFPYVHLYLAVPVEPAKPVSGSGASWARRLSCPVSGHNAGAEQSSGGAAEAARRRSGSGAEAGWRRSDGERRQAQNYDKKTTRELNEIIVFNSISRSSVFHI